MNYNTTQLSPDRVFERHVYHRDQFAHYLRWAHVLKVINPKATILDVGCGDANLMKVLYHNRHVPYYYLGIDVRKQTIKNNQEKYQDLHWAKFQCVDFCQHNTMVGAPGDFEYITSFEVLEHLGKQNGDIFLKNIKNHMGRNTTFFMSTPCYNGKDVAKNHIINDEIGEYTYGECSRLLRKYFTIKNVWGTFASQEDYFNLLTPEQHKIWEKLHKYYTSDLISVMFAPLFPAQSRNCLWELSR